MFWGYLMYNDNMNYKIHEIVEYWLKTAKHDYDTMQGLFKIKRYSDALFYGHIVLEKLLKAHVVQVTQKQAPYTHDLVRLQDYAKLSLSEKELDLLDLVNDFNIRTRYPEYKLEFYRRCTRKYAENHLTQIVSLYKKLCQKLKQKKS